MSMLTTMEFLVKGKPVHIISHEGSSPYPQTLFYSVIIVVVLFVLSSMGLRFTSFLILLFHKGVRQELNESYAIH